LASLIPAVITTMKFAALLVAAVAGLATSVVAEANVMAQARGDIHNEFCDNSCKKAWSVNGPDDRSSLPLKEFMQCGLCWKKC
ncbi:unnamed protein product, partial [Tilletia controversa]